MRPCLFLLIALMLPMASVAAAPPRHDVMADVVVSAQGEVTEFSVEPRFKALEDLLRGVVLRWRFQPATLDGKPVDMGTTLMLRLSVQGGGEGDRERVSVEYLGNGSGIDSSAQPRYPAAAVRSGASAIVLLEVTHDAAGRVTDVQVSQSQSSQARLRQDFEMASREAARRWVFTPERINGVAVGGKALVPVKYQMSSGDAVPRLAMPSTIAASGASTEAAETASEVLLQSATPLVRLADSR